MTKVKYWFCIAISCAYAFTVLAETETFEHGKLTVTLLKREEAAGSTDLLVKILSSAASKYKVFSLLNPNRLVVDVEGVGSPKGARFLPKSASPIKLIRTGSHENRIRIVFDLHSACSGPPETVREVSPRNGAFDLTLKTSTADTSLACVVSDDGPKTPSIGSILVEPNNATSSITVSTTLLGFEPNGLPVRDVTIKNRSDTDILLDSRVYEVEGPEAETVIAGKKQLVIVSPRVMKVHAREERTLRIVLTGNFEDRERAFRVVLTPQNDPKIEEISTHPSDQKDTPAKIFLTGIVSPKSPNESVIGKLDGDKIQIENKGNTSALLEDGKICAPSGTKKCTELPRRWLLAGSTWPLQVSRPAVVTFVRRTGATVQPLKFDFE